MDSLNVHSSGVRQAIMTTAICVVMTLSWNAVAGTNIVYTNEYVTASKSYVAWAGDAAFLCSLWTQSQCDCVSSAIDQAMWAETVQTNEDAWADQAHTYHGVGGGMIANAEAHYQNIEQHVGVDLTTRTTNEGYVEARFVWSYGYLYGGSEDAGSCADNR